MSLEVNITKKLNGFTLHANFAARSTATAILGASGCGKTPTIITEEGTPLTWLRSSSSASWSNGTLYQIYLLPV